MPGFQLSLIPHLIPATFQVQLQGAFAICYCGSNTRDNGNVMEEKEKELSVLLKNRAVETRLNWKSKFLGLGTHQSKDFPGYRCRTNFQHVSAVGCME